MIRTPFPPALPFLLAAGLLSPWLAALGEAAERREQTITDRDHALLAERAIAILAKNCLRCHNAKTSRNGLRMDNRDALLRGADAGPVVAPGKPDESSLIGAAATGTMPPINDGPQVPKEQVELLRRWIAAGVPWPAESPAPGTPSGSLSQTRSLFAQCGERRAVFQRRIGRRRRNGVGRVRRWRR